MFKKVEDDLILGISKVISNQKIEKSTLLIKEDLVDDINEITQSEEASLKSLNKNIKDDKVDIEDNKNTQEEEDKLVVEENKEEKAESNLSNDEKYEENIEIKVEKSVGNDKLNNEDFKYRDELFESLKGQIDYLKEQISIKDQQLQNKDELIRNFQVLMKHDKDRILLLENKIKEDSDVESIKNVDVEVTPDVKPEINDVNETSKKSGFFSWFKK